MAKVARRKASGMTDEERADAVALLHMQGWPNEKGALTSVANHLNIWPNTLRRWANGDSNPPPNNIVIKKKGEIVDKFNDAIHMILDSIDIETIEKASLKDRATAAAIMVDKGQLLGGKPTEITQDVTNDNADDIDHELARLFDAARTRQGAETPG